MSVHHLSSSVLSPAAYSPSLVQATVTTPARSTMRTLAQRALLAPTGGQAQLRQLASHDLQWLPQLCELLTDGVHRGASLGFLAPLSKYAALEYWHGVFARLGPRHQLWVACEGEGKNEGTEANTRLLGSVQLSLCPSANAHHRGEVQQLMVHSQARGQGLASRLMTRLECAALAQGRSLLVLETQSGSQAEAVYAHLGWQRAGEIPEYGACAEGQLQGAALYYKRLQRP
ncbi:GNAT family N-acetyltransferase [Paucibacter sp. Y2R2-4]|uniref:GNAT family N-acetyltransferase n=1 Tax=Paucibacter sp. Y2R2-4 TaxID=2893553 RepID=UPI0021E36DFE|nr:GNAT family N-acetyltransferase [Paucibacter sp. Y2R2-4]MCV2352278.1 GNAT family N-acetyltransferase [Paucibacter sp. Y2R2-4]